MSTIIFIALLLHFLYKLPLMITIPVMIVLLFGLTRH